MRYFLFVAVIALYFISSPAIATVCANKTDTTAEKAVSQSDENITKSLDTILDEKFAPISEKTQEIVFYSKTIFECTKYEQSIPLILVWLVIASIFLTFYFGFVNIRYLKHAIELLQGKYDKNESGEGHINRFQALMTSLSATVGLGNISGVAVAISVGGPGAMFWMI